MNRRRVSIGLGLGVVGLVLVAALGVVALPWVIGDEFDPVVWRDTSPDRILEGHRKRMAHRLVARETLVGMSRGEVLAMLGQPDSPAAFDELGADAPHWNWLLGPTLLGMDCVWLVIWFGPDGRVSECFLCSD